LSSSELATLRTHAAIVDDETTGRQQIRELLDLVERAVQAQGAAEPEYLSRLAVKTRGKVYILRVEEIDWIETAGNYVRLHAGSQSHLYRDSLGDFESKLDPRRFVRIHRSNIVNIDRIAQLEPSFHREHVVLLRDGTRLTLTAPYRARLRAIIGQF